MELKESFFEAITEGWPGDFFPSDKEEKVGDGLAEFVRIELDEGIDWDHIEDKDEIFDEAHRLLIRAINDLEAVEKAIDKWRCE